MLLQNFPARADLSKSLIFPVLDIQDSSSLIAQLVKNPLAMQEILVQFLGQEDPLEGGQATHSSILGLPYWLSW